MYVTHASNLIVLTVALHRQVQHWWGPSCVSLHFVAATGLVSFKAVGLSVDKETAKEAAAAVATCEGIVDELFPVVMTVLQNDDNIVCMTIVPFLTAYVTKLKAEQKR